MDKQQTELAIAGKFYSRIVRDGKVIDETVSDNLFIDEGLIYALNTAFAVSIGAQTQINTFYIGLATAVRTWQSTDIADTIGGAGGTALEFQNYTTGANAVNRPAWAPQAVASTGSIELSDAGFEATYDITVGGTIQGAFLIDSILKNGTGDTSANVLVAGSNFTSPRVLEVNDVFKVGYVLSAASGT